MSKHKNNGWMGLEDFKPVKILDVEISQPLSSITSVDESGQQIYRQALILARLHSYPLGLLHLDFEEEEISAGQLATQLWASLGVQINQHLQEDCLPIEHDLPPGGLRSAIQPECLEKRQELLRDAPLISIILATRDRVESLATALGALLAMEYPHFEIILVDNAPKTNATLEFFNLKRARFSNKNIDLRYVREEVPGLAVAHNRGLQEVRGSIVAFTDDDVVVDRYWLAEILLGFRAAQNVGCVTGLVIPLELQTPAQVLFEEFGGFTKGFTKQVYDLGSYRPANPLFPYAAGRFGTGANMAFQTALLQKINGFDPALGIGTPTFGADDMDAFFRTIIQGHRLVYQPSALVFHQHRRTYEALRRQMYGYGTGLTAFILKCMLANPDLLLDIALKIPAGVKYALAPDSAKNQHKSSKYPQELERIERKGMLYGPIAYLISRWRYRNSRRNDSTGEKMGSTSISPAYPVERLEDRRNQGGL